MQKFARLAISSGASQVLLHSCHTDRTLQGIWQIVPCRNSGQATVLSVTSFKKVNLPAPGNLNTRDLAVGDRDTQ